MRLTLSKVTWVGLALLMTKGAYAQPKGQHLSLPATKFSTGSPVVLSWSNTPGNQQDWVTVVPVGTPDDKWGQWTYTQGKPSGKFTLTGLSAGEYEARLYYNWPAGKFKVIERLKFSVGATEVGQLKGKHLSLSAEVVTTGSPFVLSWSNTPGNQKDWVTVVPVGTPDDLWGQWTYTKGKSSGSFTLSGLSAGDYEARLYYNWPAGKFKVIERLRFTVK